MKKEPEIEIKGIASEECAKRDREKLLAKYDELKEGAQHIAETVAELSALKTKQAKDVIDYRIKSVYRILEFMSWDSQRLKFSTINNLLVHCMNKLNGNLDGIELQLEYDYSYEDGEKRKEEERKNGNGIKDRG